MNKYNFSLLHRFIMKDKYIVMDINSGIVHSFSRTAWDVLESWEKALGDQDKANISLRKRYSQEELKEVWKELEVLIEEGMLFTPGEVYTQINWDEEPIIKAMCLHVAHDCNMRCRYCFAGTGNFGGERGVMDVATGQKALDFLIQSSGKRKHIEIDYFGGEPLLNFAVVKELVKYGKQRAREAGKILKQTLTTNALLLDSETIAYLNRENILLVLSLDGRPEVNNLMRPLTTGEGSYDRILPRIKELIQTRKGVNYYVRGTYTRKNLDFSQDVLHMVKEGFKEVSVEPVVTEPEREYALQEEDIPILAKQYELLAEAWLEHWEKGEPFNFFHFNINLDKGPCVYKRLSGCGAGHEYVAVSPEGDIYPCHQFVGQEEFKLGDVEKGIIKLFWGEKFRAAHILNKEKCKGCWARFHCSGGCHANAYHFNQDIFIPYELGCQLEKKRLECAIYLQVEMNEKMEKRIKYDNKWK